LLDFFVRTVSCPLVSAILIKYFLKFLRTINGYVDKKLEKV
jgi:hypothetical protein